MFNQRLIVLVSAFLSLAALLPQPLRAEERNISPEKLSEIAAWVTSRFEMPPTSVMPNVIFTPQAQLELRRYGRVFNSVREGSSQSPSVPRGSETFPAVHRDLVAIYDDATQTIYLSDQWMASSIADQSVLVHEMVHHMQKQAGLKYACGGARERPAYLAQKKWLEDHGLDLEQEFQIDMFTIVAMSACI